MMGQINCWILLAPNQVNYNTNVAEWSYQPKPKKRRLGQGTTWLYAITENTRGGRVSHYINSYNHYDGNLVLSSLGSQPNQMSTLYNNQLLQQMQGLFIFYIALRCFFLLLAKLRLFK